jgi:hypothetical protein
MSELTVIFLTNNELPEKWARFHYSKLLEAHAGPMITVSRKPMPGTNLLQTEPKSASNVYKQMLRAAKLADTEYIGIAEDDSLYPAEHFLYRPPADVFAYNKTHWSLFEWGEPIYNWRDRKGNYTLICNRELLINALEERFAKHPNGLPEAGELGRHRIEDSLGVTRQKSEEFYTGVAVVNICHKWGLDDRAKRKRKTVGWLRAHDIPHWGRAEDLIKNFKD